MELGVGLLGGYVMELGAMVTEQETSEFCWEKKRKKVWLPKLAGDSENGEHILLWASCPPFFQPGMTVGMTIHPLALRIWHVGVESQEVGWVRALRQSLRNIFFKIKPIALNFSVGLLSFEESGVLVLSRYRQVLQWAIKWRGGRRVSTFYSSSSHMMIATFTHCYLPWKWDNLEAYVTAETKGLRDHFRTTEVHTDELYVSVSVGFQDINSLSYLIFYLNIENISYSKAVCSW